MGDVVVSGNTIDGLIVEPRREIADVRGAVMHGLRSDWPAFAGFGEMYLSWIHPGAVKAWKLHKESVQQLVVAVGEVRFIIIDERPESPTFGHIADITLGADHYGVLRIPARVWYGFRGLGARASLLVNCASIPHDPAELERRDEREFPKVEW